MIDSLLNIGFSSSSGFSLFSPPSLLLLSHQSFYLTCVYTFLAILLLILLSCSSCWAWANHSIRLAKKSIFLYNKYSPHTCVLYIMSKDIRRKKKRKKIEIRSGMVTLVYIIHWPSAFKHTHTRTGSLYICVSQLLDKAAFLFFIMVSCTITLMSVIVWHQAKSIANYVLTRSINQLQRLYAFQLLLMFFFWSIGVIRFNCIYK